MKNKYLRLVPQILVVLLLFSISLSLSAQTFPNPPNVISATLPLSSVVESHMADLDGDGDLDVIHSYSNHLSWYENLDGLGTYGANQNIGSIPYASKDIYTADLDGDGDMDMITTSPGLSVIYWHENLDGLGTFGSRQIVTNAEYGTNSVFAEDLDGDGYMDLLSASFLSDRVAWYRNDGLGNFGAQQIISTSSDYKDVYAADIDNDGYIDVLSASSDDNQIAWYRNDGIGNFGPQQTITTSADGAAIVFAVDVDADGDMDALSGSFGDDRIAWYENTDGLGTFGPLQDIPLMSGFALRDIFPADIDGDGDADVVSVSQGSTNTLVAWHENNDCLGVFTSQETIDDSVWIWGTRIVSSGDIDLDGDIDVLTVQEAGTEVSWYENTTPLVPQIYLPDLIVICDGIFEELCGPVLSSCSNPTYNWYFNDPSGISILVGNDQCYTPDQFGDFILIAQDENGYFFNQTVTVLDGSPEPILGIGGVICVGEIISIAGQGYNDPNYEITWYHNTNVVQQGGVTLMSSFTSGTITVEIAIDGCDTVTTTVEVIECCPDDMRLEIDCENQTVFIENLPFNIAGAGVSSWYFNGNHIAGQPIFSPTFSLSQGEGTYEVTILFELTNGEQCEFNGTIEYLESNCCDELGPIANARFVNVESYVTEDTYYGAMEIPVLCDFTLDASASLCEENYTLSIAELDLLSWNTTTVLPWTAFSGPAGNSIDLAQLMQPATFTPGQAYLLAFNVGPNGTTEYLAFIYGLNAVAQVMNSNTSITLDTPYGPMEVPMVSCGLRLDGSQSSCENSYHIMIQPYNYDDWTPAGGVIYDEWFSGQAPFDISIPPGTFPSTSNGQFYLLTFAVGPTYTPTYIPIWYYCNVKEGGKRTNDLIIDAEVVSVFPNPASTVVNLRTSFDSGTYQVFDIQGRLIDQKNLNSMNTIIDLSTISSGTYFLRIESITGEAHLKKIIKQ
jgi:hypothetical protein